MKWWPNFGYFTISPSVDFKSYESLPVKYMAQVELVP